jgi:hypothetical protein
MGAPSVVDLTILIKIVECRSTTTIILGADEASYAGTATQA